MLLDLDRGWLVEEALRGEKEVTPSLLSKRAWLLCPFALSRSVKSIRDVHSCAYRRALINTEGSSHREAAQGAEVSSRKTVGMIILDWCAATSSAFIAMRATRPLPSANGWTSDTKNIDNTARSHAVSRSARR